MPVVVVRGGSMIGWPARSSGWVTLGRPARGWSDQTITVSCSSMRCSSSRSGCWGAGRMRARSMVERWRLSMSSLALASTRRMSMSGVLGDQLDEGPFEDGQGDGAFVADTSLAGDTGELAGPTTRHCRLQRP
jgi:hypothetical protein